MLWDVRDRLDARQVVLDCKLAKSRITPTKPLNGHSLRKLTPQPAPKGDKGPSLLANVARKALGDRPCCCLVLRLFRRRRGESLALSGWPWLRRVGLGLLLFQAANSGGWCSPRFNGGWGVLAPAVGALNFRGLGRWRLPAGKKRQPGFDLAFQAFHCDSFSRLSRPCSIHLGGICRE